MFKHISKSPWFKYMQLIFLVCKFKVLASNKYEAQTRYEELNKSVKEKRYNS